MYKKEIESGLIYSPSFSTSPIFLTLISNGGSGKHLKKLFTVRTLKKQRCVARKDRPDVPP